MISRTQDTGATVDGVQRYANNGIKVIVVGGGVGGLGAALECWRKGCDVVVLERAKVLSPLGDYFTITPSALTTLKDYPSMHADYHECVYNCSIHIYTPCGVCIKSADPEWNRPGVTHVAPNVNVSFLKRRPVYAKMQLDQLQRLNVPVQWEQKVISVCEKSGCVEVKTADGNEYVGDLCIGANGINSPIDGFNTGPEVAVQDSGYAVARVAFPREVIKPGSPAASLLENVDNRPEFRVYVADDLHLILFLTPHWVAWVFTHVSDGSAKESWQDLHDSASLIHHLEKASPYWDPAVLDFLHQTPSKVVDWKLRWRDGNEHWTSEGGRLLLLGDAAHAYLPAAGNGAVQALEDSVSIGECLRLAGKQNVCTATKVHTKLRFQRTSILQQTGFLNREELHTADTAAIESDPSKANIGFFKIGRWVWAHDPEKYARDNFASCRDCVVAGKPFHNTNLPPGHVYTPWSLESENRRMRDGVRSGLKENGDWSA